MAAAAVVVGAVRGEVTEPGFVHDLYSSFYPLTLASRYVKPPIPTAAARCSRWT